MRTAIRGIFGAILCISFGVKFANSQMLGFSANKIIEDKQQLQLSIQNPGALSLSEIQKRQVPQIQAFDSWLSLSSAVGVNQFAHLRIVGGDEFTGIPAIGAILRNSRMHCTGSVVAPQTVLTAAHCIQGYDVSSLTFVTGPEALAPQNRYDVTATKPNENYVMHADGSTENDIGLLYLAKPFSGSLAPIPTTDIGGSLGNATLAFIGYGYTAGGNMGILGQKRRVDMSVARVNPTTFYYNVPGKNTCNGDSGGPALKFDTTSYTLVGVTSYGDSFCQVDGFDTRVNAYRDWIRAGLR